MTLPCVVIAGRRGAAGNGLDLPLPEGYAFDEQAPEVVSGILNRVALSIMQFDSATSEFAAARAQVREGQDATRIQVETCLEQIAQDRVPA